MLTLNLIPPQLKHDVQTSEVYHRWFRAVILLGLCGLVASGGLVATWQLMVRHGDQTHRALALIQQQQAKNSGTDLTKTTTSLNTTTKLLATVLGSPRSWSRDMSIVLSVLPSGTTVSELSMQAGGKFHLVGIADSRQTFVTLDQALKANPKLQQVATTSAASKRTAVPFDYSGIVTAEGKTP